MEDSAEHQPPQEWIVGLDTRAGAEGALRFSRWLHETAVTEPVSVVGVYAREEPLLQAALRYHRLAELDEAARLSVESLLEREGATWLRAWRIDKGNRASATLESAHKELGAKGIIVGRLAPGDGGRVFRLGKTTRQLLRRLPGPVIVVPPDYKAPCSQAAVVVATDFSAGSEAALRFASRVARMTRRPLTAIHFIDEHHAAQYIPRQTLARVTAERAEAARRQLEAWLVKLGTSADREVALTGSVAPSAVDYARSNTTALLVCGSRRLSLTERLMLASNATELCATAPCPVAVVPPVERTPAGGRT